MILACEFVRIMLRTVMRQRRRQREREAKISIIRAII